MGPEASFIHPGHLAGRTSQKPPVSNPAQSRAVSGTATFSRRTSLIHEFDVPSAPVATTAGGSGFPVRRVFCVGRNYAAHAREMGRDPDREPPFFFTKWAETVVPSGTT